MYVVIFYVFNGLGRVVKIVSTSNGEGQKFIERSEPIFLPHQKVIADLQIISCDSSILCEA